MGNWQTRFWIIFSGQAFSQVGSAISQFVLLWWITSTTKDVSSLATAGTVALLPQAILGPVGGVLADRYSRKVIMIITDLITALCMMILIVLFSLELVELWHVYTLLFVRSSMQAFQGPASQASYTMLVPTEFLGRAAGLNQSVVGLMTVAAAPIGALAISTLGIHAALSIDVITAVMGVAPLLFFSIPQPSKKAGLSSPISDFRIGVRFVWSSLALRHIFYVQGAVILVLMPLFTLVPLLVTEHFKGDVNDVAIIEGLSGIGMLIGSGAAAYFNVKKRALVFILGLAVSCLAVSFTALSSPEAFSLAIIFWFISGAAYTFGAAPLTAILQASVPNAMQGRVFSLMTTLMGLAAPIGLALLGPIGSMIGVRGVFIASGVLSTAFVLAAFLSKDIRDLDHSS